MISTLKILSGYAIKLPRLKEPIDFQPGLSVLFGENATGKSTVLKIVAAYCSIDKGGWSKCPEPWLRNDEDFPKCFKRYSPGSCEAELQWDGTATLFSDALISMTSGNDGADWGYGVMRAYSS